jgi:hypothetical protein
MQQSLRIVWGLLVLRTVINLATVNLEIEGLEPPPVAILLGTAIGVALVTGIGLYFVGSRQRRLGAWVAIAVTVLDLLLTLPVLTGTITPGVGAILVVYVLAGVAMIVLLRRSEVWANLR